MKNICISSTFLCLCPLNLSFKLNFNISKKAYWDIPFFAVSEQVRQSGCEIYRSQEEESSGGRNELPVDREQRKETRREAHQVWPPMLGTQQQFPGYDIRQYNIIIDVLGGWSNEVDKAMRELFRA